MKVQALRLPATDKIRPSPNIGPVVQVMHGQPVKPGLTRGGTTSVWSALLPAPAPCHRRAMGDPDDREIRGIFRCDRVVRRFRAKLNMARSSWSSMVSEEFIEAGKFAYKIIKAPAGSRQFAQGKPDERAR